MELFASTVIFEDDGKLTIYDKTQGVQNVQHYVCNVLEMKPEDVRVMSPFVGGGFGSGLRRNITWCLLHWQRARCSARCVLC